MTAPTIDAYSISRLRERDLALRAELADVDDELVALGVNPHLEPLIVAILRAAAAPLTGDMLWRLTQQLMLHTHTWTDYVRHLDRLHGAGQIVPVGAGRWTVPSRLPTPRTPTPTPEDASYRRTRLETDKL